jgi:hypothetical protein
MVSLIACNCVWRDVYYDDYRINRERLERDSNGNNDNNNNGGDDNDDDDKKDYAFQIESDGGPSADPESVDGTVYAGEKNIERNNGKDFDIKDVFNDCQISMFDD